MDNDLLCFIKNVQIKENKIEEDNDVTIMLEIKEMLEENDKVKIIIKLDNITIKEIEIKRR